MARSPYLVEYEGSFDLALAPAAVWEAVGHTERFEDWWLWLRELRLEGDGLAPGSRLHGVVVPPLPYRMTVEIGIVDCTPPRRIDASVHGDLEGRAALVLAARDGGTRATVSWTLEMTQRPMRLAALVAHPLLQWGHDRVVEATVEGFRRHIEASGTTGPGDGRPGAAD